MRAIFKYIEVSQGEIRPEKVEAALRMLAYSCSKLEIPTPRVHWFAPEDNPFNFKAIGCFEQETDILGLAKHRGLVEYGGEVWIRADLSTKETAEVVAHETLHCMQFYTLPLKYSGIVDKEKLADEFALAVASESYLKDDDSYLAYLTGRDFSGGRFKSKETAEAWADWRQKNGKKPRRVKDITQEDWFKESARREAEAERLRERRRRG